MPHERPFAHMAGLAKQSRAFLQSKIDAIVGSNRDARILFLDNDGRLRPEAERLFARLASDAQMHRIGFDPDARHQDYIQGKRDAVRFLANMLELDTQRLERLQRQLGEAS